MAKTLTEQELAALSRLFSSSLIRELARKGHSPMFARIAKQSSLLPLAKLNEPVGTFFDLAFSFLKRKDCRHEYIYKAAITHKLLLGTHSLNTSVLLNEFRVGRNKADSVLLNGTSTVYEIKSERDSLKRLEQQIASYRKVFAQVNVITGENHFNAVMKMVPADVGVLLLNDRYQISTQKAAQNLPARTETMAIFDAIRISEAKKILKMNGFEIPKVPNTKICACLREIFCQLPSPTAHAGMINVLRQTRSLTPLSNLIHSIPDSMQSAVLSTPLRKKDHPNLINAINNTSINVAISWG